MVAFSIASALGATAAWLGTAATIAQTAALIGSIAYQRNQEKKIKAKMAKAAEARKGFEVTRQSEAINLPVFYGYNKAGSLVTDAKVKNSYTYTGLGLTTTAFPSLTSFIHDENNYIEVIVEGSGVEGTGASETVKNIFKQKIIVVSEGVQVYESENLSGLGIGLLSAFFDLIADVYEDIDNNFSGVDASVGYFLKGNQESKSIVFNSNLIDTYIGTYRYSYRLYESGNNNFGTLDSASDTSNAILMTQNAIAFAGIDSVVDLDFDETSKDNDKFSGSYRIGIYNEGGIRTSTFSNAGFPNTNYFTNTASADCIFKLNRDDPQYTGIPAVAFYLKGQRIRDIIEVTDPITQAKTYEFTNDKYFSNNPALVLADYLTNSLYGRGLADSDLDLETFYKAKLICDTPVDAKTFSGKVFGGSQPRDIKLYEFNDVIDTELEVRENVDKIVQSMQQAFLVWSGGKYKLQLSYPNEDPSVENGLVHESHVFTDDNIIQSEIAIDWPKAENKYNQVTVRFANALKNFKPDSVTWPKTFSDVHNLYLEEDNQQPLKTETALPGIIDPYHALARAEEMVRNSRTTFFLKVKLDRKAITLEPGDFFLLKSEIASIKNTNIEGNYEVFRVESITYDDQFNCEVTAYSFNYRNLAWNIDDDVAYAVTLRDSLIVPIPQNVQFTATEDGIYGVQSGIITWEAPLTNDYDNFTIEISTNANSATPNWTTLGETSGFSFDVIGLNAGTYSFRVKSKTNRGAKSEGILAIDPNTFSNEIIITKPLSLESLDGFNTATLVLYTKTEVGATPVSFDGTATYNFETDELTGLTLGDWSRIPPNIDQGEYLWSRTVFVKSRETIVEIVITEWSASIIAGIGGRDGINSKPLFLYAKTSGVTAPTLFSGTGTFDFNTNTLSGITLGVWSQQAPALDTNEYLWVSTVIASSVTNEATIPISEWSTPVIRAYTGANGKNSITLSLYKKNDIPEKSWDLSGLSSSVALLDVTSQQPIHYCLTFKPDGTKVYIAGLGSGLLDEYNLTTAWDISSGVYNQSFDLATSSEGISFNNDGSKLFVSSSNRIREYTLSTPWDISSTTYVQQSFFSTLELGEAINGIEFGDSGNKLYIVAPTFVESYSLATPYSIQNKTLLARFNLSFSDAEDLRLSSEGDRLYVLDRYNDLYEYSLSTNWDISSSTLLNTAQVSDIITTGLAFKDDGTRLYVTGVTLSSEMVIREYQLNVPDLFTGTGSFDFNTNSLSGVDLNGWSREFPNVEAGRYVWMSQATVISDQAIAEILISDWSTPIVVSQAGIQGTNGVSVKLQYSVDGVTNWHDSIEAGDLYVRSGTLTPPDTEYVYGNAVKIVPEKGVEYDDGDPGTPAYLHIAYADTVTGVGFSQLPDGKEYLGSYTDSNPIDSTNPADYTWVRIKGDQGVSNYVHLKYSNDGGVSFTANNGDDVGDWLGSLVDTNEVASTNPADYTWVKIKGEDAIDGIRGAGWFRYETGLPNSTSGLSQNDINDFFTLATSLPFAVEADRLILVNTLNEATGYILENTGLWNEQEAFIDGDLMVDGTITGQKLSANTISALNLKIGTLSEGTAGGERIEISDGRIVIYDSQNEIRVVIGDLTGLGI